jgi:hypothetical protein
MIQNWENLIAERTEIHGVVKTCRIEDPVKRNRQNLDRRYKKSPKRIAQHKAWAQSPAGKKSSRERGARYRATENGREHCRKKSRNYFLRHRNDPAWRTHRLEVQKAWKAKRKAAKILKAVPFEISFTLQDIGSMTVHIYKGVA